MAGRLARMLGSLRPGKRAPQPDLPDRGGRDPLGPAGESAAAKHLKRSGYRILGKNLRVPMGEADLLCLAPDRRTIVLVEVKARRVGEPDDDPLAQPVGFVQPPPEASVHAQKRRKLTAILRHLARANRWVDRPLRIDVVAVEWPDEGEPILRHHVNAVGVG